jgi:hypothetical protein
MNTAHGPQVEGYRDAEVNYTAEIKELERDGLVERIEEEIEAIQEELDQFNHTTKITV